MVADIPTQRLPMMRRLYQSTGTVERTSVPQQPENVRWTAVISRRTSSACWLRRTSAPRRWIF